MSFFKKKKEKLEDERAVLPNAKSRALREAMEAKERRLGPLDLKRDMARFMNKHKDDKLDTRRIAKKFKFKGQISEE